MMDVVSGPELLHVDFWYISSDLKCFEEGSEFESIQYHLKSRSDLSIIQRLLLSLRGIYDSAKIGSI
ncbi:hypothetical protein Tco_0726126 [Tanacetum coccineum]|uniref:Uncharacterized protein n=1 Tax=Tanacetum coccineum TaxID=301880 RepID=A0ABQ4YER8_9ASTR